ncbi:MAG: hypothetical protein L3K00_08660 [Thermoplasmata archaeon]|nr:hypothetical protein [Thermoplasmata archaeon]
MSATTAGSRPKEGPATATSPRFSGAPARPRRWSRHPFRDGLGIVAVLWRLFGSVLTSQGWTAEQDLARQYGPPTSCGLGVNCTVRAPLQDQPAYETANGKVEQGLALHVVGILVGVTALLLALAIRRDSEVPPPFDSGRW